MSRAVVLLSGGLDSCTAAAQAQADGHTLHTVAFDYGQRHAKELASAAAVAAALGADHRVLEVPLGGLGGSALTDNGMEVPDAPDDPAAIGGGIPVTYVPARNTVFLALGLAVAETVEADAIYIGANAVDYSGYPDCRPEYLEAFERMAQLATKRGVEGHRLRVVAPLLHLSKEDIVKLAARLGAPVAKTWSCYRGGERACGRCESCTLRRRGFAAAGVEDPIEYEEAA